MLPYLLAGHHTSAGSQACVREIAAVEPEALVVQQVSMAGENWKNRRGWGDESCGGFMSSGMQRPDWRGMVMERNPLGLRVLWPLLVANGILWLGFSLVVLSGRHRALPADLRVQAAMAALAALAGMALLGLSWMLRRRRRVAYYGALALLLLIAVLTVTDDFGLIDLLVLALTLAPVALIIKNRSWFLGADR